MSSVKIHFRQSKDKEVTEVLVDNKSAYLTYENINNQMIKLKKLIDLLQLENVEIINKERV